MAALFRTEQSVLGEANGMEFFRRKVAFFHAPGVDQGEAFDAKTSNRGDAAAQDFGTRQSQNNMSAGGNGCLHCAQSQSDPVRTCRLNSRVDEPLSDDSGADAVAGTNTKNPGEVFSASASQEDP